MPKTNSRLLTGPQILETWQAKCLRTARGQMFSCLLSVLAHNFDDDMLDLLHALFPGFRSIREPFLCSAAWIQHDGHITADVVMKGGIIIKAFPLFTSERHMRDEFRRLADRVKLTDEERQDLFTAVRMWVVADRRLDPNMDPQDPDAKRLVH